jgi:hypothetical protein
VRPRGIIERIARPEIARGAVRNERAASFSKAREKTERRHMAVASEPSSISRIRAEARRLAFAASRHRSFQLWWEMKRGVEPD